MIPNRLTFTTDDLIAAGAREWDAAHLDEAYPGFLFGWRSGPAAGLRVRARATRRRRDRHHSARRAGPGRPGCVRTADPRTAAGSRDRPDPVPAENFAAQLRSRARRRGPRPRSHPIHPAAAGLVAAGPARGRAHRAVRGRGPRRGLRPGQGARPPADELRGGRRFRRGGGHRQGPADVAAVAAHGQPRRDRPDRGRCRAERAARRFPRTAWRGGWTPPSTGRPCAAIRRSSTRARPWASACSAPRPSRPGRCGREPGGCCCSERPRP